MQRCTSGLCTSYMCIKDRQTLFHQLQPWQARFVCRNSAFKFTDYYFCYIPVATVWFCYFLFTLTSSSYYSGTCLTTVILWLLPHYYSALLPSNYSGSCHYYSTLPLALALLCLLLYYYLGTCLSITLPLALLLLWLLPYYCITQSNRLTFTLSPPLNCCCYCLLFVYPGGQSVLLS